MIRKQSVVAGAFVGLATIALATNAAAHAISIGYENAGAGSVNIWLGTYEHGGHHTEGSLQLQGVSIPFGPVVAPFNMLTCTGLACKPAGLVDGVTNFYVQGAGGNTPLVPTQDSWLATFPGLPANHWQGVNFSGLAAGTYQFTWIPAPFPTAEWSPWSSAMNGTFDLSGVVQPPTEPPVPEPASLLLFGAAMGGIAVRRYRHASR